MSLRLLWSTTLVSRLKLFRWKDTRVSLETWQCGGRGIDSHLTRPVQPSTLHTFCVAWSALFAFNLLLSARLAGLCQTFAWFSGLSDAPRRIHTLPSNYSTHSWAILQDETFAFAWNLPHVDHIFRCSCRTLSVHIQTQLLTRHITSWSTAVRTIQRIWSPSCVGRWRSIGVHGCFERIADRGEAVGRTRRLRGRKRIRRKRIRWRLIRLAWSIRRIQVRETVSAAVIWGYYRGWWCCGWWLRGVERSCLDGAIGPVKRTAINWLSAVIAIEMWRMVFGGFWRTNRVIGGILSEQGVNRRKGDGWGAAVELKRSRHVCTVAPSPCEGVELSGSDWGAEKEKDLKAILAGDCWGEEERLLARRVDGRVQKVAVRQILWW